MANGPSLTRALKEARDLLEPGEALLPEQVEYTRGMFELLANLYPAPGVMTPERAGALAEQAGLADAYAAFYPRVP